MNLHLQGLKPNESNKKKVFQKQTFFKNNNPTAFYRIMCLTLLLAFFGAGAWAQVKPAIPHINTGGGGDMIIVDGGGGGGAPGCNVPNITTNITTQNETFAAFVNGTAPQFTIYSNNATSYQWYKSTTTDVNSFTAIPGATGTTYTPDVSTIGTLYYVGNATNSCGTVGTPIATMIVSAPYTMPVAGTVSGGATVCTGSNSTTLTLSGYTGTIQWQSSTNNLSFAPIIGATGASYTATNLSATTWYEAVVSSDGFSATSTSVAVNVTPSASAGNLVAGTSPQCIGSTTSYLAYGVVLSGGYGGYYSDNHSVATVDQNGLVTAVGAGTCNISYIVYGGCGGTSTASKPYTVTPSSASAGTVTAGLSPQCVGSSTTYTVSGVVLSGGTGAWSSSNTAVATVDPTGKVTAVSAGTCNIVYTITGATCGGTVTASQPYTVNPNASAGAVTAGTSPQCIGSTTTYTVSGAVLSGGTGAWSSSNSNIATVDATTGRITAKSAGTCEIIYTVTGGCGGQISASHSYTVNPNASAGAVTAGTSPQCIGSTTTYTVSGAVLNGGTGAWSSSNTAVATVDPSSGLVTAISPGTCNIVYSVTGATCGGTVSALQPAFQPYTVTPNASAGTVTAGTSSQCIGSKTTYTVSGAVLSGGTGAWSSSNTAVATVDPTTGVVTAIGGGTCNIVYSITGTTCGGTQTASQPYTVNPNASAGAVSAGTSSQCIGSTTTYTVSGAVVSGGTGAWSSSNTAVATVDPSSGLVTAIGAGTCSIIYTVTGGCGGQTSASHLYTVNPNASAGTVNAGTSPQCIGSTTTYTLSGAVLSGGTGAWSSSNTAVATVDPSSGLVTAISPGTCNIVYSVTGATCGGTQIASQSYTVTPIADPGTVAAGTSPQCIGSTTTYTVSGAVLSGGTGTWSSSNTAVATVDPSSGLVTAIGGGTSNIIYTVTGGCGGTQAASQSYSVIASIDASANSNPIALGSAVSLSATISPAISGVTITFNLGPGTGIFTTYTAVTNSSGIATTSPISGLSVNVYKVIATAAGCAISNAAYLPVYDPNSSFVTGGGWIISPAGALVAQPLLSGKANFGFVAKYQKGNNQVNGNTEFDFQDGNFNFASSSLNAGTLVISGAKATYRGVGTVNGTGNYGFMVSAVDGEINGGGGTDLFRIKIWDINNGNTVVYDNNMGADENGVPTTALGGGSIVIHYAKTTTSRVMGTGSSVEVVNGNSNQLIGTGKLTVKVMPNPSSYHFTFGLNSLSNQNLKIVVTDIIGRVIDLKTNVPANSTIQLGDNYQHGIYIAEFLQGNDKVTLRLLKE